MPLSGSNTTRQYSVAGSGQLFKTDNDRQNIKELW